MHADALDSLRRVVIGNEPLAAKVRNRGAFDTLPRSGWKGTFLTLLALIQISWVILGYPTVLPTHRLIITLPASLDATSW